MRVVFGRRTGVDRRGFLGGTGLAAMGAAVGGSHPVRRPTCRAGSFPRRSFGARRSPGASAAQGTAISQFSRQGDKLVVLGERPLVAETPEHLLDDDTTPTDKFFVRNNGQMPEAAKDPDALEDRRRRRGQPEARAHARRAEVASSGR